MHNQESTVVTKIRCDYFEIDKRKILYWSSLDFTEAVHDIFLPNDDEDDCNDHYSPLEYSSDEYEPQEIVSEDSDSESF